MLRSPVCPLKVTCLNNKFTQSTPTWHKLFQKAQAYVCIIICISILKLTKCILLLFLCFKTCNIHVNEQEYIPQKCESITVHIFLASLKRWMLFWVESSQRRLKQRTFLVFNNVKPKLIAINNRNISSFLL